MTIVFQQKENVGKTCAFIKKKCHNYQLTTPHCCFYLKLAYRHLSSYREDCNNWFHCFILRENVSESNHCNCVLHLFIFWSLDFSDKAFTYTKEYLESLKKRQSRASLGIKNSTGLQITFFY